MPDTHDWRADVRARLAASRLHPQDEAEVVEEVAQHLETQFAELTPKIGAAAAREHLLAQLRRPELDEAAASRRRRARPSGPRVWSATSLGRDVRHGVRSLRRSPGTVAAGIAALALGIGLTTIMYSIIYGLLIKGLPFDDPGRIAMIYRADPSGRGEEDLVPFADFVRYRSAQRSFTAFGAYSTGTVSVSGGDRPERVEMARMTAGAFDVTGVPAIIGRTFVPADNAPDAPPTAILGYAMWRDRFARDSGVVGTSLRVNGQTYTIIGVMPAGFEYPRSQRLWLPVQLDSAAYRAGEGPGLIVVGRLRKSLAYENANAELAGLSRQLARERADTSAVRDLAQPFVRATMPARIYSLLYAMLGAVLLVLLVACANVANLLLDRASNRAREIGIRVAIGASRIAIIRQSLVESTILALLAAVAGTGLAQAGIMAFNRAVVEVQSDMPFWMDIRLHVPVLLFVLGVAVVASVVSGLLPAIHAAHTDVDTILKDQSPAASPRRIVALSRLIVVAEIALSSAMLLAAGFMTKSIVRIRTMDPRFTTANVFTANVTPSPGDSSRQRRFVESLDHDLAAVPGLDAVYVGDGLPGTGWNGAQVAIEGRVYRRPQDRPVTRSLAVSPGFFRVFGVSLLSGRPILATDRAGSQRVAVVDEAFVRRHFPNANPIGHRIRLGGGDSTDAWLTIIGVMPTLYATSIQNHWPPEVLTALWQGSAFPSASIAARGPGSVANAATVRKIVAALDPEAPISAEAMMDGLITRSEWMVRVLGGMFVLFGIASLMLAAIGLYAVMAFSVSRRAREMGVRVALGATSGDVIRLICRQGATQAVIGMTFGFVAGAMFVRVARAVLFDVQPSDPSVFALVAGVLGAASLVACLIPAVGATRVDPVIALRAE